MINFVPKTVLLFKYTLSLELPEAIELSLAKRPENAPVLSFPLDLLFTLSEGVEDPVGEAAVGVKGVDGAGKDAFVGV